MTGKTQITSLDAAICTHDRANELRETLASLATLEQPQDVAFRLIIVLNACDADTVAQARMQAAALPFATRVVEEKAPGLSHARNRAIRECTADWLAFLDDDVRVSPGWARGLVDTATRLDAQIVGGRTTLWWRDCARPGWWSPHFDWIVSAFDHGDEDRILQPPRAIGANFACSRRVLASVGFFDPDLGRKGKALSAGEESDYLARADALGFRGAYSAFARVEHLVAPKRLEADYFRKVAYHQGRAYYHAHPRRGLAWMRAASYQLAVLGRATLRRAAAPRDSANARYALVKAASALGALGTLFGRISKPAGRTDAPL